MTDLSQFDPNSASNPNNNIFGLPFQEEDAEVIILPVPWEVTVAYNAGTARATDHIKKAALHVDLYDSDYPQAWKSGFFIRDIDKKILMKSDYLRKEAELYIDYISNGEDVSKNQFMCKSLKEINEGSDFLNNWVFEKCKDLLAKGKLVGLLGGDHSVPLGFMKALAASGEDFGILQIDAHCDLMRSYEGFKYSHASIMFNALEEIPQVNKLVQLGVRDYCQLECDFVAGNREKVLTYFDKNLKEELFEGKSWKQICLNIIEQLPQRIYLSFDIDGLDPKLCPNTGTPVPGGFETDQIFYLLKKILESGRKIIGFDLTEVGVGESEWDANVGARVLLKLCNILVASNKQ